jgi:acyl-CoA synthetase (AMP-forming)/AMP-acid ligase II
LIRYGNEDSDRTPFPTQCSLSSVVLQNARVSPDSRAVTDGTRELTHAELWAWAATVAEDLKRRGVREGQRVALLTPNCLEWIVTVVAAESIGATAIPLNVRSRPEELRIALREARPSAVVLADSFLTNPIADRLQTALADLGKHAPAHFLLIGEQRPWADAFPAANPDITPADDPRPRLENRESLPLICYWTSGTTGAPKGIVHSNQLLMNVWNWTSMVGYSSEDVLVTTRPYYYISGSCWSLFASLLHRATLVVGSHFTPQEIFGLLLRYGGTIMTGGTALYEQLLRTDELRAARDRLQLRGGFFGGTAVRTGFVDDVKAAFGLQWLVQTYGMTELHGFAASTAPRDPSRITEETVGTELPGFTFQLRGPEGDLLAGPEAQGELWVRGPQMLVGYLRGGNLEPATDDEGWFRTGDMLARRPDGRLQFIARLRDVAKIRGENVALPQVDAVLNEAPGVARAVTVIYTDEFGSEALEAVIEPVGSDLSPESIRGYCRERLAPFKVPTRFTITQAGFSWPLTITGKVARHQVAEIARHIQESPAT